MNSYYGPLIVICLSIAYPLLAKSHLIPAWLPVEAEATANGLAIMAIVWLSFLLMKRRK
ncbi:hypothetical protein [Ligilactobacillus ceti]|uniref:Uncharacterized protein n=1 Tax=Ligilactobacillus ceti DSM 22408 TaxID=1122146 RepID=A0A0R2KTV6_9LACO|nr:hypothetical protein [Ligilactobacillus ceti]KRN89652.1 hypothetical protein IV53_GL001202 [Ligilactobacillus ceti DSM 22408]